jgi:phosphohistidine phosphatase
MKTLLLMRHAKASAAGPSQADVDRPLNERGQRDAARMGAWLREQDLRPDLVISSTARRAAETAAALIDASGFGGPWQKQASLYEAAPEAYFEVLQAVPDEHSLVLIVAHNPGTEEMIEALTGEAETMATAAVAHLSLPIEHWYQLSVETEGQLVQVGRPRELA